MKYKLTDKRLSELVLLASVPKIVETFPDYTPSLRTIYRRLEKCGITKPRERKRNYKRTLLFSAPSYLTDREAEALIDTKIQTMFEELRLSIEQEAALFNERFG